MSLLQRLFPNIVLNVFRKKGSKVIVRTTTLAKNTTLFSFHDKYNTFRVSNRQTSEKNV